MEVSRQRFDELSFEGGRFERGGFPVSTLRELQVYCDLVLKAAKALFLRDNPSSRRVPNGFASRFNPRLILLADGSVTPVLEQEYPPASRRLEDEDLPPPTAFPTPEGGVSLEWIDGDNQIGVMIFATGVQGELSYWKRSTDADDLKQSDELNAELVARYVRNVLQDEKI